MNIDFNKLKKNYKDVFVDSREVTENSIFVAIPGLQDDGNKFVNDAIAKGAKCIISENNAIRQDVEWIKVENAKVALQNIAEIFYPKQPEDIIAVTGTSGKTSIVNICQNIFENLSLKSCSVGTLGVRGVINIDSSLTTPDFLSLRKIMNKVAGNGVNFVAMEASSHGLELGRIEGIKPKVGIFTNFTQDHLDFHLTWDSYFSAKMKLFNEVMEKAVAVLNYDIPEFHKIADICNLNNHRIISYGKNIEADFRIVSSIHKGAYQEFTFSHQNKEFSIKTYLLGEVQVYNIIAAIIAVWQVSNKSLEDVVKAANNLRKIPGRMEVVWNEEGKIIFVDYAHKPDSLEKCLIYGRNLTNGKLHLVFGCGGDRDKGKRKIMGEIACNLADEIIITDDNPRTEDPKEITAEIFKACSKGRVINDRSLAIKEAIYSMKEGDVLIIAGKGHENYQIIGNQKFEFDDAKQVLQNIDILKSQGKL